MISPQMLVEGWIDERTRKISVFGCCHPAAVFSCGGAPVRIRTASVERMATGITSCTDSIRSENPQTSTAVSLRRLAAFSFLCHAAPSCRGAASVASAAALVASPCAVFGFDAPGEAALSKRLVGMTPLAEPLTLKKLGGATLRAPCPDLVIDLLRGIDVIQLEMLDRSALRALRTLKMLRATKPYPLSVVRTACFWIFDGHVTLVVATGELRGQVVASLKAGRTTESSVPPRRASHPRRSSCRSPSAWP